MAPFFFGPIDDIESKMYNKSSHVFVESKIYGTWIPVGQCCVCPVPAPRDKTAFLSAYANHFASYASSKSNPQTP
jgi:hypothetical protein